MTQLRSLLVPVTNSPASLEAVTMACRLAKPTRGKVAVVYVIEVLRTLPLNVEMDSEARRGEQLLRQAEEAASRADYKVTGELLQAREAGPAIVDEARDRGVDAIVLGIGYKRLVGDFQVGRTADYVLKHAPCQVWIVRQAVAPPD